MSTTSAVLGLLQRAPRHGYDLKREHDRRFPLAYSQVYATLGRPERDGLVEVTEQQAGDGPKRTVYALATTGRRHIEKWVREPEPPAPHVANVLYAKLIVALLGGQDGATYLDAHRTAHLVRMCEPTREHREADPAAALAADYALFHLAADLRWLETTLPRYTPSRVPSVRLDLLMSFGFADPHVAFAASSRPSRAGVDRSDRHG